VSCAGGGGDLTTSSERRRWPRRGIRRRRSNLAVNIFYLCKLIFLFFKLFYFTIDLKIIIREKE